MLPEGQDVVCSRYCRRLIVGGRIRRPGCIRGAASI